jgi:hypothetical protein
MRKLLIVLAILTSFSTFASEGKIEVTASRVKRATLDLVIEGAAAETISEHLRLSRVPFRRDPHSGALVQSGDGIRCIGQHANKPLYCYIELTGNRIN